MLIISENFDVLTPIEFIKKLIKAKNQVCGISYSLYRLSITI